jgi:hypothetical protein
MGLFLFGHTPDKSVDRINRVIHVIMPLIGCHRLGKGALCMMQKIPPAPHLEWCTGQPPAPFPPSGGEGEERYASLVIGDRVYAASSL